MKMGAQKPVHTEKATVPLVYTGMIDYSATTSLSDAFKVSVSERISTKRNSKGPSPTGVGGGWVGGQVWTWVKLGGE